MNTIQKFNKRAESPIINSVGHRPTKRCETITPKPQWGVIKFNRAMPYPNDFINRALPYPNDVGLSAHHHTERCVINLIINYLNK